MIAIKQEVEEIKKFQEDFKTQFGNVLEELRNLQDALKNVSSMQWQKPREEGMNTRRVYCAKEIHSVWSRQYFRPILANIVVKPAFR